MPDSPRVVVNGIELTDIDLSQGLSVHSEAGHVVVNGEELPATASAEGLTIFAEGLAANGTGITITNIETGAATSNGPGGVAVTGVVIGGLDTISGPVLLNVANTGSADASGGNVVTGGASAMGFEPHDVPAAFGLHVVPDFHNLQDVGPDWLFG